jgi:DNA-directed RNA polymerase specialized sigma24 family protein
MINMEVCSRIVDQEMRRSSVWALYRTSGDSEDVRQELLVEAWKSAQRHDGRDNTAYVRVSVRNAIKDLARARRASSRMVRDQYGRPQPEASLEAKERRGCELAGSSPPRKLPVLEDRRAHGLSNDIPSPEDSAMVRQIAERIFARLNQADRSAWLVACASGISSSAFRRRVRKIGKVIAYPTLSSEEKS